MVYTTVDKKIKVPVYGLSQERQLMKQETDTGITGPLWGGKNCWDCSTNRLLKTLSELGHTELVDCDETEAVNLRLNAGADCPDNDSTGSQNHNWDYSQLSRNSQSMWSDYMNRIRSLTNMGQELLRRLNARDERRRQNAQNHAAQTPLGYGGHVSTNDTLRRPPVSVDRPSGQEPQVDNRCHNTWNDTHGVAEPSAPRRLFNASRLPQPRTCNRQGADVAAPSRRSRMNVECSISTSRLPRPGTCNEREAGVVPPPRGSRHQNAQLHATRSRAIPTSQIPRSRTCNQQGGDVTAPPRGSRMNFPQPCGQGPSAPQFPIYNSRLPRPRTYNERVAGVVPPPRGSRHQNAQLHATRSRAIPTSQIPRSRTCNEREANVVVPPRDSRSWNAQDHAAQSCPIYNSEIPNPRNCSEHEADVDVAYRSSWFQHDQNDSEWTTGTEAFGVMDPLPMGITQTQFSSGPNSPDECGRHSLNEICQNNEDNAIDPCEIDLAENPRIAETTCPIPRCSIPLSQDTPLFTNNSPNQYERRRLAMERFLNECECSYIRPLGSPWETSPDRDRHYLTENISVPSWACQPSTSRCPPHASSGYGSHRPNISGSNNRHYTPPSPRYQTYDEALNRHRTPPARQEQDRTIRITGSINLQIFPEHPEIQDITPPSGYYDLDFSDETDNENNKC